MKKKRPPLVFFNASVILAGLASPGGGSAKLFQWSREGKVRGVISETILDEVVRRADKIGLSQGQARKRALSLFPAVTPPPSEQSVAHFKPIVLDYGDAHVLAAASEVSARFLVTLDKKHLLSLKDKVKNFKIVSPKQLIETLGKPRSTL